MTGSAQLSLFDRFWRAAGLNVDPASVREPDRNSGYADIVCRLGSEDVGFELTAATNEKANEDVAHGATFAMWIGAGEVDGVETSAHEVVAALRRKAKRHYRGSTPVELVIHEGLASLNMPAIWIDAFETEASKSLLLSIFRRVWAISHSGAMVYAVYPRNSEGFSPPP